MPGVVIIPIKSFALGKRRLAGALDSQARAELGQGLAQHVASTVAAAGELPLIVTADPEVAEWATRSGFPSIPDPGQGLNAAAGAGVDWAGQTGGFWLVLHGDLPLLEPPDVTALIRPLEESRDVIAPSSDGGTSAIGSADVLDFAFGVSSFHRHITGLTDPMVITRPGLLLDVDSPADFDAASNTQKGRWMLRFSAVG